MGQLQGALERVLRAPQWVGYALLALAVLMTVLGRHGQRPLNAVLLAAFAFALAFFGLRALHAPSFVPGAAAIVLATLAVLFALLTSAWGTAFVVAAALAAAGGLVAFSLHLHPFLGAAPLFGVGLLLGMTNYVRLSLLLPPLFSACFGAIGAAIAWAPRSRGVLLLLSDVRWTIAFAAALALPLTAVSFARDARRSLRAARS